MFNADTVTAICGVLGVLGGVYMFMTNFLKSRMADIDFNIRRISQSPLIFRVRLIPQRVNQGYKIENIYSSIEIFNTCEGLDMLDNGKLVVVSPLSLSDRQLIVPSKQQHLSSEKTMSFYIDLSDCKTPFYSFSVACSSQYFPWKWRKRIDLPVVK